MMSRKGELMRSQLPGHLGSLLPISVLDLDRPGGQAGDVFTACTRSRTPSGTHPSVQGACSQMHQP